MENKNNPLLDDEEKRKKQLDKKLKEEDKIKQKEKENKTVEKIKKSFAEAEKTINDQNEKILRLSADFINMKKRQDEEISKILKYEGEDLIKNLLLIIDDFERATEMIDKDNLEVNKYLEGFKIIRENMLNILKEQGVIEINAINELFDPNTMNAVMMENNPDVAKNIVTEVMQKGYMYKDKVIRVAMVKVNE